MALTRAIFMSKAEFENSQATSISLLEWEVAH
jgi:hypothetical protein